MRRLLALLLVPSLALAATGQRAGVPVEADVSNRKVTSTGGTTARSLALHMAHSARVVDDGAVGNGSTDDTAAIQHAINRAGVGGTVEFQSGRTYSIRRSVLPLAGQTWIGYGATLKRANEVKSTLAVGETAGTPPGTVSVVSAAGFEVGDSVTFVSATVPPDWQGAHAELKFWQITAINGNAITLNANSVNLEKSYVVGDFLVTAYHMISTFTPMIAEYQATGFRLLGLKVDGNKAGNATVGRYEINAGFRVFLAQGVIRDCLFINSPSDAIEFGGADVTVEANVILDSNGNGIHFGGDARGLKIIGNTVRNFSILGEPNGHQDGAIIASNDVYDSVIAGNFIETGNGYPGVGSWNGTNNGLAITGNYMKDVGGHEGGGAGVGTRAAIEVNNPAATAIGQTTISGNTIVNGRFISLGGQAAEWSATSGLSPVAVTGNYLESTGFLLDGANGVVISGNAFYKAPPTGLTSMGSSNPWMRVLSYTRGLAITGNSFIAPETLTSGRWTIRLSGVVGALISGNTFEGMGGGVALMNSGAVWPSNVRIDGNVFRNQGVQVADLGSSIPSGYVGNAFSNNTVIVETGFGTGGASGIIQAGRGAIISGNVLDVAPSGVVGIYFGPLSADAATPGPIVSGNTIRMRAAANAVSTGTNARNAVVKGNFSNAAFTNGGAEPSNTFADNTVIVL